MSAADDVLEMKSITNELADRLVGKVKMEARIGAVVDSIRDITSNRALEFLRGKASRVDAWEKERAKRQRDKLRSAAERQRETDHLLWLERSFMAHISMGLSVCFAVLAARIAPWRYRLPPQRPTTETFTRRPAPSDD